MANSLDSLVITKANALELIINEEADEEGRAHIDSHQRFPYDESA